MGCPELWGDAEDRRDLIALACASRRSVLELECVGNAVADKMGPPRDRSAIDLRWHEEVLHRGEPDFHVLLSSARHDLWHAAGPTASRRKKVEGPSRARARQDVCTRVREHLANALDRIASGDNGREHLGLVAALTIPGLSLHDAREATHPQARDDQAAGGDPRALDPDSWVAIFASLLGTTHQDAPPPEGVLRLVPTLDQSWLTAEAAQQRTRQLEYQDPVEKLLKEPGTRVLWHPAIQEEAARLIGKRIADGGPGTENLRRCFERFHRAVRKRFRQTGDGHYDRAALLLRLLAGPRPGQRCGQRRRAMLRRDPRPAHPARSPPARPRSIAGCGRTCPGCPPRSGSGWCSTEHSS